MELHLKIISFLLLALALVHVGFPKRFNWKTELQSLSLINRQMMKVHTFFIALALFLIGILCLYSTGDLVNTPLGKQISIGLSIFWTTRLAFQFFVYSPELWKGKIFETCMHLLFSILWLYFSVVFLLIGIA